jgi:hypothetical protein
MAVPLDFGLARLAGSVEPLTTSIQTEKNQDTHENVR